jgi:hypothetical protein
MELQPFHDYYYRYCTSWKGIKRGAKMSWKAFMRGMRGFGMNISVIVNTALLLFVYFIGVGLSSIAAKLLGKRFIETKLSKGSYWKTLNLKKKPMVAYYRQF